ncbi:MAG: hypothetical protein QG628_170 [Patescibacteria group bacterium]|nr:hypothetical protein [Patescibacteria group bacterium]
MQYPTDVKSSSSFLQKFQKIPKRVLVIVIVVIVGLITLIATKAASPTTSLEPENGTKSGNYTLSGASGASGNSAIRFGATNTGCGKKVQNYSYQVPFGNAVWNQPICGFPAHPASADYVSRFFEWGHINDGSAAADVKNGRISTDPGFPKTPTFNDPTGLGTLYTTEVYHTSNYDIVDKKVATTEYPSNLDGEGYNPVISQSGPGLQSNLPSTRIPWNNTWKSAGGTDAHIVVVDDRPGKNGAIYTVWGYETGPTCTIVYVASYVCAFAVRIGRCFDGKVIDYMTHEGYTKDRGVGLNPYATLTTADEVKAGEIRHALGVSIPNPSFGPDCTDTQLANPINWNVVGKQCGTAVAPASKFEWRDKTATPFLQEPFKSIYTRDKSIPEGMRFALNLSYDQIDNWIDSRTDFNQRRADTARIFARALKDYGMMVVDTNTSRFSFQTEGGVNPLTAATWKTLAMGPEYDDDLLDGLITANNMYVVNPPNLTCRDGSISKFYCEWSNASYGN